MRWHANLGKGRITVSTRIIGDQAEIRISDSGTGQGLAIAHNVIVNKHGGTIGLESTPGKGSAFIIRIPIDPASADPETAGKAV